MEIHLLSKNISQYFNCTEKKVFSKNTETKMRVPTYTVAGPIDGQVGNVDGDAYTARFGRTLEHLTRDGCGNTFVLDSKNKSVRKIDRFFTVSNTYTFVHENITDMAIRNGNVIVITGKKRLLEICNGDEVEIPIFFKEFVGDKTLKRALRLLKGRKYLSVVSDGSMIMTSTTNIMIIFETGEVAELYTWSPIVDAGYKITFAVKDSKGIIYFCRNNHRKFEIRKIEAGTIESVWEGQKIYDMKISTDGNLLFSCRVSPRRFGIFKLTRDVLEILYKSKKRKIRSICEDETGILFSSSIWRTIININDKCCHSYLKQPYISKIYYNLNWKPGAFFSTVNLLGIHAGFPISIKLTILEVFMVRNKGIRERNRESLREFGMIPKDVLYFILSFIKTTDL